MPMPPQIFLSGGHFGGRKIIDTVASGTDILVSEGDVSAVYRVEDTQGIYEGKLPQGGEVAVSLLPIEEV